MERGGRRRVRGSVEDDRVVRLATADADDRVGRRRIVFDQRQLDAELAAILPDCLLDRGARRAVGVATLVLRRRHCRRVPAAQLDLLHSRVCGGVKDHLGCVVARLRLSEHQGAEPVLHPLHGCEDCLPVELLTLILELQRHPASRLDRETQLLLRNNPRTRRDAQRRVEVLGTRVVECLVELLRRALLLPTTPDTERREREEEQHDKRIAKGHRKPRTRANTRARTVLGLRLCGRVFRKGSKFKRFL